MNYYPTPVGWPEQEGEPCYLTPGRPGVAPLTGCRCIVCETLRVPEAIRRDPEVRGWIARDRKRG
jgi:hypothetical protein